MLYTYGINQNEWIFLRKRLDFVMFDAHENSYFIRILKIPSKPRKSLFLSSKIFIALLLCSFCSLLSGFFKSHSVDRMKKFKRRLSLTLRGSQTIDESLSELAEQMTIEENSSKDNGKYLGEWGGKERCFSLELLYKSNVCLLSWLVLNSFLLFISLPPSLV